MKRKIAAICIVLLLFPLINATARDLDIFGYFEPQLMGAELGGHFYQLSSNKLRIDLQSRISDMVMFGANFDYITYHGTTQWNVLDFLPEKVRAEARMISYLGMELNPYLLPYEDRQFLDNAYLKLTFKYADVTIGKQQLSLGTGYAWNPTDVFNQKELIDPTYEQPGHNAFRLDVPLGRGFRITSIYAPSEKWEDSDVLVKVKGRFSHFDFSVMGIQKYWKYSDTRVFNLNHNNFLQLKTKRQIGGADLVGELFGLGVWLEYAYNDVKTNDATMSTYFLELEKLTSLISSVRLSSMEIPDTYYELVAGMDYTFDFQSYIMFEFYRNTSAKTDHKTYSLNDWMQYLLAEKKAIARDQLYAYVQHPVTDFINIGSSAIYSISDGSLALVPMITYNIFENVDLSLFVNYYLGDEGTAYAENLGNGGMVRAKVYF
ncbi:hypothetical protein JXJ21_25445 [candidate division KSB1 bacterium]|nr:hypothetical protein [candidate division KSB1 bacterium]